MKAFLIAGEPSGDALGARLIKSLKAKCDTLEMSGIGGEQMAEEGFQPIMPMENICAIGLIEVASQVFRLNKVINQMVKEIIRTQPDVVITIDLPDFNFLMGKRLKATGQFKGKLVHYVAPTVWAWRPARAAKVSQFLDGLMCLFPFEPEYFTKHGLRAEYTGHPIVDIDKNEIDMDWFDKVYGKKEDGAIRLGIFFGSRVSEFNTMAPVIKEALLTLLEQHENIELVIPTLPSIEMEVTNLVQDMPCEAYVLTGQKDKWNIFAQCDIAMAVSGTVGLELAYLQVPHFITYKVNPISWVLLKLLVKVKYAHLANIMLDKPLVPEYLQLKCTPLNLARQIYEFIKKPEKAQELKNDLAELEAYLKLPEGVSASDRAAEFVLSVVKDKARRKKAA